MSISKPFTFTAGTRARASEVNQDFDTLYTEANRVASEAITLSTEIQRLDEEKANINGSSTQRFQVADAVNSGDAMNKQMVDKLTYNSRDYISGLIITKDSGSPNDTVIVDSGSCYDTTHTTMMIKQTSTTKQNSNQGANTTYYIHLISDDTGNTTDILIATVKNNPPLPTNYTKYRCIGSYTTNTDSKIAGIVNLSNKNISYIPDYTNKISIVLGNINTDSVSTNGYVFNDNGWIYLRQSTVPWNTYGTIKINNCEVGWQQTNGGGDGYTCSPVLAMVSGGDKLTSTGSINITSAYFIPFKEV